MVFARKIATRLQPYFGHRSATRLIVSARALRCAPAAFGHESRWRAFRALLSQFTSHEVAGVEVTLHAERGDGAAITAQGITDTEGFVHFDIAIATGWPLPDRPAWDVVTLAWHNGDGPQTIAAYILAPGQTSDLAVISDIDDTVIETGITGNPFAMLRNSKRIFAQLPQERIAVPHVGGFYSALGSGGKSAPKSAAESQPDRMPATKRPFFYVSSSPWNLFSYLVAFQRHKGLPLGPLKLRDWGFNRRTLGKGSHGDHKREAIATILEMYPHLRFALIGDDTQGDLPAFAHAAQIHPDRIAAVFLRRASDEAWSVAEEAAKVSLEAQGIPLWIGETYATGANFLHKLGFTQGGETEQIVRAVDKEPTAKKAAENRAAAAEDAQS